ncbi:MAG: C26 family cysteine hydrolase domain-containing family [Alphaproteobacteria bacterium]|jgi:GMP synthase (glutamine-hydrolysing)|nr:C26 family cysteine hydrolase domain-containing family [Alphaproteobacteria bacterium]MBT4018000.1 C26 family cysteine hydrolase domain-containing family [Alphaproteobacteria bacterium]MBT5161618.1 C26 family cysteine hydrolase domain-containing family [Alphaproteobacteria bacterium]MBT6387455.1 C26 family cysteine hydrolase domain-containing family [Alphaproteobacteria bacterium]
MRSIFCAMTGKILLVMHQETSNPGRVARQLRDLGYGLDLRRPSCGDPLPANMDDHEGAVIFGGPMSANDDHLDYVRTEIDWIETVLASGKPYLGICLGAQMMVRTLGGQVRLHKDELVEIGYHQIKPTEAGEAIFDKPMCVYQWHKEGFDLPSGANLLAGGDRFDNQAFKYGDNGYGIQFHPEVTNGMMMHWLTAAAHMLEMPGAQARVDQIKARRKFDNETINWLRGFLQTWLNIA